MHPKLSLLLGLLLVLAMASPAAAQEPQHSYARIVRLSLVEGDAQVYRPEDDGWRAAVANLPLKQGYMVSTAYGRVEVEFESAAVARIAENSALQFSRLMLADGGRITQLVLTHGTGTFTANLARRDSFEIITPHLQVTVPEKARVRLDVDSGSSRVAVLMGEVSLSAGSVTQQLSKNQAAVFYAADQHLALVRAAEDDEWDRWVSNREDVIHSNRNSAQRYVRAPFSYGVADLGRYGTWNYHNSYGYVWSPAGVPWGWTPYSHGTWIFVRGIGWTWVSMEPWGWVPYHYGRWAYIGTGWCWIPGYFHSWHPGPVHWVNIGGRYGWVPRGPGDRPGEQPENLPGGVIVKGTLAPDQHERRDAGALPQMEVLADPPERLDEFAWPNKPTRDEMRRGTAGAVGATPVSPEAPREGRDLALPAEGPARGAIGGRSTIVYDADERRFINNPEVAPPAAGTPVRTERPRDAAPVVVPPDVPQAPAVRVRGADTPAPPAEEIRPGSGRTRGTTPPDVDSRSSHPTITVTEPRGEATRPARPERSEPAMRGNDSPQRPRPQTESRPSSPPSPPSAGMESRPSSPPPRPAPPPPAMQSEPRPAPPPPARPTERPPSPPPRPSERPAQSNQP